MKLIGGDSSFRISLILYWYYHIYALKFSWGWKWIPVVAQRHLESNANALYLLGMAALELGKPGEAVNLLNKSLLPSWQKESFQNHKVAQTQTPPRGFSFMAPKASNSRGFWIQTSKLLMWTLGLPILDWNCLKKRSTSRKHAWSDTHHRLNASNMA